MSDNLHPAVVEYLYNSEPAEIVADYLSIERLTEPYEPIKMKVEKLNGLYQAIKIELAEIKNKTDPREQ